MNREVEKVEKVLNIASLSSYLFDCAVDLLLNLLIMVFLQPKNQTWMNAGSSVVASGSGPQSGW
jgi:hypothetical protein